MAAAADQLAKLDDLVTASHAPLTYKQVSRQLGLTHVTAKHLLHAYVAAAKKSRSPADLTVLYCITGRLKGSDALAIRVVRAADREATQQQYASGTCHIYAVMASKQPVHPIALTIAYTELIHAEAFDQLGIYRTIRNPAVTFQPRVPDEVAAPPAAVKAHSTGTPGTTSAASTPVLATSASATSKSRETIKSETAVRSFFPTASKAAPSGASAGASPPKPSTTASSFFARSVTAKQKPPAAAAATTTTKAAKVKPEPEPEPAVGAAVSSSEDEEEDAGDAVARREAEEAARERRQRSQAQRQKLMASMVDGSSDSEGDVDAPPAQPRSHHAGADRDEDAPDAEQSEPDVDAMEVDAAPSRGAKSKARAKPQKPSDQTTLNPTVAPASSSETAETRMGADGIMERKRVVRVQKERHVQEGGYLSVQTYSSDEERWEPVTAPAPKRAKPTPAAAPPKSAPSTSAPGRKGSGPAARSGGGSRPKAQSSLASFFGKK
ncbi:hypothetical protein CXG81DRAFT_24393 [Caulochytrium protostelioides]|uniref:DNA polymerase delta subunit 3 n=1 Tax=Caulochytrium protostelioides TaxID=1555241 RepID=A0A4P9XC39_9FUNG|nr:hypothetical protein CXG81DRAFT_24393 [Caulochytrium protostelioides]|eukprot:RKP02988.1 hypothetical protein CXG81DRAFT_24393 [Caulochytrium protostelioides]